MLSCTTDLGNIPDWVAILVSAIALLISGFSLFLQYKKQRWLDIKIVKYSVVRGANYAKIRLRLINRKNRKHSISHVVINVENKTEYLTTDDEIPRDYMNDFFQEGESKFVVLCMPAVPEDKFYIKFYTDGVTKKLTQKSIRKYLKANPLSRK